MNEQALRHRHHFFKMHGTPRNILTTKILRQCFRLRGFASIPAYGVMETLGTSAWWHHGCWMVGPEWTSNLIIVLEFFLAINLLPRLRTTIIKRSWWPNSEGRAWGKAMLLVDLCEVAEWLILFLTKPRNVAIVAHVGESRKLKLSHSDGFQYLNT